MGGPDNTFQWFNSSNNPLATSSLLVLFNVAATDGGEYRCEVSNSAGSSSATITIFISPYFIIQPQNTTGRNGSTVILTCVAEAFPSPTFQWRRADGKTIRNTVTGQNSEMLMFPSLEFGDEGCYYCTVASMGVVISSEVATLSGSCSFLS